MAYNQDLINQAHQICQKFLREKDFDKMDMIDKLLLENIPIDLAQEVVSDYEINPKQVKKDKGKRHLTYGMALLFISVVITVAFYVFTGTVYIVLTGLTIVPGVAYIVAGLWEMID